MRISLLPPHGWEPVRVIAWVARMGLARRDRGARRRRCQGASPTTRNDEIARNPHAPSGFPRYDSDRLLRQFADADVAKLDRRAFGFHAEVSAARLRAAAAGDLLAVHPQADLAVDGADVVVIPLAHALAQIAPRK